jgi:hypothetical protein
MASVFSCAVCNPPDQLLLGLICQLLSSPSSPDSRVDALFGPPRVNLSIRGASGLQCIAPDCPVFGTPNEDGATPPLQACKLSVERGLAGRSYTRLALYHRHAIAEWDITARSSAPGTAPVQILSASRMHNTTHACMVSVAQCALLGANFQDFSLRYDIASGSCSAPGVALRFGRSLSAVLCRQQALGSVRCYQPTAREGEDRALCHRALLLEI